MGGASANGCSPCASIGTTSKPARRNSPRVGTAPNTSGARHKLFTTNFSSCSASPGGASLASFEHGVNLPEKKRGYLDLFWKGKLLVEQKSAGRSLIPARAQALDYFPGLKEHELPRYILLSDFQNFELYDLDIAPDRPVCFRLQDLPDHVQDFGFIAGQERRIFRDQDPVNILA